MQNNEAKRITPSFECSGERVMSAPSTEVMEELLPGEVPHQVEPEFDQLQELPKELPRPYSTDNWGFRDTDPDNATPLSEAEEHGLSHLKWYYKNLHLAL